MRLRRGGPGRKILLIAGVGATVAVGLLVLFNLGTRWFIGQHQKSVIMSLQEWEREFADIGTQGEAFHAIGMYEYARWYYTAGEGYFSSEKMSRRLEGQRQQTLAGIVSSLERYTGLEYGHDIGKWKEWEAGVRGE